MPTPFVAAGVSLLGAAAGIMVTASHNTKEYNGYKVRCALVVTTITKAPRDLSHTSSWPFIVCLLRSAQAVSDTHLTLPTNIEGSLSVSVVTLKQKTT